MAHAYRILSKSPLSPESLRQEFLNDVKRGLSRTPRSLSSRYFYDEAGSLLFEKIMDLPEYYLTNAEHEILLDNRKQIAELMGDAPFNLVELGAGDGRKTKLLLEYFQENNIPFRYVPIDISEGAMRTLQQRVESCCPSVKMIGLVGEYFQGLNWMEKHIGGKSLVLFLGSNVGNFNRQNAIKFLGRLHQVLSSDDYVFIGFDLKKQVQRLNAAYNDAAGITARFNLNLLQRINRDLGGEFNLEKWRFYAGYNPTSGAIESHLLSTEHQEVRIAACNQTYEFDAWEAIHTEYSFKYSTAEINQLANESGFVQHDIYLDKNQDFADAIWKVEE